MAIRKFFSIAYRNLARNGRRTALTALAVGLGLVVVLAFSSLIEGMVSSMVADGIRVSTGHLQIRAESYDTDKASLLSRDLLKDAAAWSAQAEAIPEVQSAAPVLWSGGLLSTAQESFGIAIVGIDTEDHFHELIREGIVAGEYLNNDDRGRILVGKVLADQMDISVGQRVSLAASNANGEAQEGIFTVAGLVDTGFPSIDQNRVILPLAQAQSFAGVGDRFSSLILMLNDQDDTAVAAAKFTEPETQVLTWRDLNGLIVDTVENALFIYYILYGIVFLAVAVLIANTLLISVFARAREIGILASLGMNGRQIRLLFLIEGFLLAVLGVAIGLVLGLGLVSYMTFVGITIPAETATLVEGLAFGTTIYGGFAPGQFAVLSFMLLVIVSLVSLYPASLAAKMEPVEALHSV
jgi:ABC-type lipoprotein release transport system permease subunit